MYLCVLVSAYFCLYVCGVRFVHVCVCCAYVCMHSSHQPLPSNRSPLIPRPGRRHHHHSQPLDETRVNSDIVPLPLSAHVEKSYQLNSQTLQRGRWVEGGGGVGLFPHLPSGVSSHPHILTFSHPHTLSSHILTSSHPHILTSSHSHVLTSSHLSSHILTSSHPLILSSHILTSI